MDNKNVFVDRVACNRIIFSLFVALLLLHNNLHAAEKALQMQLDSQKNTVQTQIFSFEKLKQNFAYDTQLPLDIVEHADTCYNNIRIKDISFQSIASVRVNAYLVLSDGTGPFAGMIFMHWGQGNREEFMEEAKLLATKGVASLLLSARFKTEDERFFASDNFHRQTIINMRRAVDLLCTEPQVDTGRIAYVGHSFGATQGGVLAGIEKRIKAFVLMGGYAKPSLYYPANNPGPQLDAIHYIGKAPAPILFQFATQDEYITLEAAKEYFNAASEPKFIQWFEAGHQFNEKAQEERIKWLSQQLHLK